ncbi:MAG: hypothetical protein GXP39_15885 [Chloroflexi bacterium]|nr:hypothetical protein [Chloroflexota bacterium]
MNVPGALLGMMWGFVQDGAPRPAGSWGARWDRWAPRALMGALFVALLVAAGLFAWHGGNAILFPYPVDYGEGPLLDQAVRLSRLENIYRPDISTPPYTVSNYPPLFVLLQAPFVRLFGPAFWYGRTISFLSVLAAAVFIGLTIHALTGDGVAGAVGGLLLLSIPYVLHWGPLCRVDSLALGLSWAGLWVIVRWPHRRWALGGAIMLLTAAVYTRQSYALAAPAAAFLWLWGRQGLRRALALAIGVGGLGLGLFALLEWVTDGGFFFHIVTANVNTFYIRRVIRHAIQIVRFMPVLSLGMGITVGWLAWSRSRAGWLVGPYAVGGVLTAMTIGKVGSSVNYLFELSAAFALAMGVLLAGLRGHRWLRPLWLLLLIVQVSALVMLSQTEYARWVLDKVAQRSEIERLMQVVHEADGTVLADEYMGLIPLDGRPLYFQPFEFKQLAQAGIWDQRPFLDAISRGDFAVILIYDAPGWRSRRARWTPQMLRAISSHYRAVDRAAYTTVYRPR